MTTSEAFGALSFPVEISALPAQGDPGLYYLAQFIKAAANAEAGTAWDSVCSGRNVIDHTFLDDPRKSFDELRLPALYVYQTGSKTSQEADNILRDDRTFAAYWIMEPAQEDQQTLRSNMANAVYKSIFRALIRGRHPAWIVDGDTDPLSVRMGSWMWGYAGFSMLKVPQTDPLSLQLEKMDADGKPMAFYGVAMTIETIERTSRPWPGTVATVGGGHVVQNPPDDLNPENREVFEYSEAPS